MEDLLLGLKCRFTSSRGQIMPLSGDWSQDSRRQGELTKGISERCDSRV
jgi:hypothetical protein